MDCTGGGGKKHYDKEVFYVSANYLYKICSNVYITEYPCQVGGGKGPCTARFESRQLLVSHYRTKHRGDKHFSVACLYFPASCSHDHLYKTEDGLRKHLQNHHVKFWSQDAHSSEVLFMPQAIEAADTAQFECLSDCQQQQHIVMDNCVDTETPPQMPSTSAKKYFKTCFIDRPSFLTRLASIHRKNNAAFYLLQLLEESKLPQTALQCIMERTTEFINQTVASTVTEALETRKRDGCEHAETLDHLGSYFANSATAPDYFEGLKTQHSQRKHFVDHFKMVMPDSVLLPDRDEDFARVRTEAPQKSKRQSYVIISLIAQLQTLLSVDEVYHLIHADKPPKSNDDISCFEDGSAYKESPFFQAHPKALQIHLYLDEVTVVDPLSSRVLKNKLVFVYFALGNLPPKYRSCLRHIHLLSIFLNTHIKFYGLNLLLKPILLELKQLENGVEIILHGQLKNIHGTLALLTADNLASHEVGGFKKGFSKGTRPCRYCLGTKDQIQCCFEEGKFRLRTKESHDLQVKGLGTARKEHFAKLYGLTSDCILNELQHFHVIGGLVPDLMHDVHEGALGYVMCLVLEYCIEERHFFTCEQLNQSLATFDFGHSEVKDKPSVVERAHIKRKKLRQSAVQIAMLAFILPLLVGSLVPPGDERWHCFTTLLEIFRLLLSSSFSQFEILKLKYLIFDFLTLFKTCFPNANVKPKLHHLLHYPRYILLVGPLVAFWCMRFEAKHSYFKQISHSIGNFINLPLTLASRHQQSQCLSLNSSNYLYPKVVTPDKVKMLTVKNILCKSQFMMLFSLSSELQTVRTLHWVKYGSSVYKKNSSVVLCPTSSLNAFGKIIAIYGLEGKIIFLCELFRVLNFDSHLQAFHVKKRNDRLKLFIQYHELSDHSIYSVQRPVQMSVNAPDCIYCQYVIPRSNISSKNLLLCDINDLLRKPTVDK